MLTISDLFDYCLTDVKRLAFSTTGNKKIGKILIDFWTFQADAGRTDDYYLTENIQEWAADFQLNETDLTVLVYEVANIIVQYDSLLDRITSR